MPNDLLYSPIYKASMETSKTLWRQQNIIISGLQTAKLSICISTYLTGCVCLSFSSYLSVCLSARSHVCRVYIVIFIARLFSFAFFTHIFTSPLVSLAPTAHTASVSPSESGFVARLNSPPRVRCYITETGRNEIGGAAGLRLRMRTGISVYTSDGLRVKRQRRQIPPVNHIKESQSARPDEAPTEIESMPDTDNWTPVRRREVRWDRWRWPQTALFVRLPKGQPLGTSPHLRTQWKVPELKAFPTYHAQIIDHIPLCFMWRGCIVRSLVLHNIREPVFINTVVRFQWRFVMEDLALHNRCALISKLVFIGNSLYWQNC